MKLGTRLFIFSSIFIVLLPWFGFHFVGKIEQSLLQGQEESQSVAASAISTVLNGYSDLFNIGEYAIYVYPLSQGISIDGYEEDWLSIKNGFTDYANQSFSLLLADNSEYLYFYIKVRDKDIVYRNPRFIPLDSSDHIRIEYLDKNNSRQRLVLLTEGQGNVSVYEVNKGWQTWKNGRHVNAVYGVWHETDYGYDVEVRMPKTWLQPNNRFSLAVVNVFSQNERNPDTVDSTQMHGNAALNPLLFQSRELTRVIENLNESDLRICVIDKYRRVRAVMGSKQTGYNFCHSVDTVDEAMVADVLNARNKTTVKVMRMNAKGESFIVATSPILDDGEIIGAVLVGKNSRKILSSQRDTLKDVVLVTLGLVFLMVVSLLVFSSWLTFRINRLKNQASSLIDEHGRFIRHINLSDSYHHDEVGSLSRSFSALLDKLNSYAGFLETVPRMLRHEILNPVNTISMTLQKLSKQDIKQNVSRDIDIASNAVNQIQLIVSSLTEAANIDEALSHDEISTIDIAALLFEYVKNLQARHGDVSLRHQGPRSGLIVKGNDLRLVQLLDKIKDNAIDFSVPGSDILFKLGADSSQQVTIRVINEGELVPLEQMGSMFQGMVSQRSVNTGTPHLGIGLFVAQKIAQFHQGCIKISNWRNTPAASHDTNYENSYQAGQHTSQETNQGYKQGVEVSLILPLVSSLD